ncbi:hypothetical protein DL93DRAFT_212705 [Clavulina sp. PMI_390]|nr:hypothetical protein DL93DRAFT_212705 [Clavulina sp. PMI_390]
MLWHVNPGPNSPRGFKRKAWLAIMIPPSTITPFDRTSNTPIGSQLSALMSTNSVQKLNNWLQQSKRDTRVIWDDVVDGPTHEPVWTCTVTVEGRPIGTGKSNRKNLARDLAAQAALAVLNAEYDAAAGRGG